MSRIHCIARSAAPILLIAGSPGAGIPAMAQTDQSETPANIVADQIRRQGYKCDRPGSAERDIEASRPDAPMWVLACGNATYRVRLKPDMAAEVEQIE